ncbi:MAG: flagellar basal body L-ring protein FlgH [Hyphomonadaceae bacterium]|nr:flagellar basal body L-ring protein FlgH [Hyphomonadaceae bacterium]
MRTLALIALAASAAGCVSAQQREDYVHDALAAPGAAYNAAQRALGPPQLQPVQSPVGLTGGGQQTMPQPEPVAYETPNASSLWRSGSRSFFNDQRATDIGDIITVEIEIDDSANISNSSDRQRESSTSAGVGNFFGLEEVVGDVLNSAFDTENMISAEAESEHRGSGAINRQEKIELTVAAVIVDRLPNGNLVIAGRQEVRINGEVRELTVSGVIRPEDVTSDNTIDQTQIAEARISYGGRGSISAIQRPNWGQRIGDAISPW